MRWRNELRLAATCFDVELLASLPPAKVSPYSTPAARLQQVHTRLTCIVHFASLSQTAIFLERYHNTTFVPPDPSLLWSLHPSCLAAVSSAPLPPLPVTHFSPAAPDLSDGFPTTSDRGLFEASYPVLSILSHRSPRTTGPPGIPQNSTDPCRPPKLSSAPRHRPLDFLGRPSPPPANDTRAIGETIPSHATSWPTSVPRTSSPIRDTSRRLQSFAPRVAPITPRQRSSVPCLGPIQFSSDTTLATAGRHNPAPWR